MMGVSGMNMVRALRVRVQTVAFLMLLLSGMVATAVAATPASASGVYADPQGRFAIAIGDGWTQARPDTKGVAALWVYGNNDAIFNIVVESVPFGTSSVDYAKANIAGVSSQYGYTEIDRRFITSADQDAPLLDYTVTDENGDTQRVQQVFVTDGKRTAYVLTLRTYSEDAAAFRDQVSTMVYSFSI